MENHIKWWLTPLVRNMWFLSLSINYINIVGDVFSELVSSKKTVYPGKYSASSISLSSYQRISHFSRRFQKHTSASRWFWLEKLPDRWSPYPHGASSQAQNNLQNPLPPLISCHNPLHKAHGFFPSCSPPTSRIDNSRGTNLSTASLPCHPRRCAWWSYFLFFQFCKEKLTKTLF